MTEPCDHIATKTINGHTRCVTCGVAVVLPEPEEIR